MKEHMNSVEEFKRYSNSVFLPEYFRNYVNKLEPEELNSFYHQVCDLLEIIIDENYFLYKFRWIRMKEIKDLTKEVYLQYLYNAEGITFDVFKPGWEEKLDEKYQYDMDVLRFYRLS